VQPLYMLGRFAAARASAEAALDARRHGWASFPAALAATFARVLIDQDRTNSGGQRGSSGCLRTGSLVSLGRRPGVLLEGLERT
jgi:hypothetical protein